MEPIGLCGGGLVGLGLLLAAILGVAFLGGGLVIVLVKLGLIVDRAAGRGVNPRAARHKSGQDGGSGKSGGSAS